MPAPKLKPEVIAQYDRDKRREWRALSTAMSNLFPDQGDTYADQQEGLATRRAIAQQVEAMAWALSCPEGMPPYPRRGETYSNAEAYWILLWIRDVWPVMRQLHLEEQATYTFLHENITPKNWHENISFILEGYSSREVGQALHTLMSGAEVHSTSTIYMPGGTSVTFDPAGKTPKEWVEVVWQWALRHIAPVADDLRRLRDPLLYARQTEEDAIDEQLNRWEAVSASHAWRAANRFYGLHAKHDRLPDMRRWRGVREDKREESIEYLRYAGDSFGPAVPWSEIIRRVREKNAGREAEAEARSRARETKAAQALRALASAPISPGAWNAGQAKRYLPGGFSIQAPDRYSYTRPGELILLGPADDHIFLLSAGANASRAAAYLRLGELVERFRADPKAALRSLSYEWGR